MIDLLVAGAGPVGLGTALLAARAGLDVLVADPHPPPTDKACGEGLMPAGVRVLAQLGVRPAGQPLKGIRYLDDRVQVSAAFRGSPGLGVRRTTLQAALARAVAAANIPVVPIRVGEPRQYGDHVAAAGVRARYVAVADGLHSGLRRRLGLQRAGRGPARFGLRRHFAVAPWTDHVEVHWSRRAEAYVTPVAPELVGVAVLFAGRGGYDGWLRQFPRLGERLAGAAPASAVLGAGPFRQRVRRRVCGRLLLVGDAAGYLDALTGDGISTGLQTAAALVHCVRQGRPAEYEAQWRRITRRNRLLTGTLLAVSAVPPLRAGLVPAAARWPVAFAAVVNALAGT